MGAGDLLRDSLLWMAGSATVRSTVERAPASRGVVRRFVAGEAIEDAVAVSGELRQTNRMVTIDHLGEDLPDVHRAERTRDTYLALLAALADRGLTQEGRAEVSVTLSAIGQRLSRDGDRIALDHARAICAAARAAGTTVTLDVEDHTTTDATLAALVALREDFPSTGAVLQASLRRTEGDCRDLAREGSRVRLCKGAYQEPESVAYQGRREVDAAYVRCLKLLLAGPGYPMVASHDPRLLEIARALAAHNGRAPESMEYQMLLGIRSGEQRRIADRGDRIRVYVPFGEEWYGYLMRRVAERPATTMSFLRGLASRG